MKAMKPADIRKLVPEEIRNRIGAARDALMKLPFKKGPGQLTYPSRLNILRKDVARMETILREMERAAVEGAK